MQLGTRSWANSFSKRPATEAVQVPDSSTTTSIPVVTEPRPPAPAYFTPWPSTKSGMNTTEKGTQIWTAFGWDCECLHGKCTGMLWLWGPQLCWDKVCTQGQERHIESDLQGLYSKNRGAGPNTNRVVQPQEQREIPTQVPVQALDMTTQITFPIKIIMTSILWGKMWLAFIPKTALTPKILDLYTLNRYAST